MDTKSGITSLNKEEKEDAKADDSSLLVSEEEDFHKPSTILPKCASPRGAKGSMRYCPECHRVVQKSKRDINKYVCHHCNGIYKKWETLAKKNIQTPLKRPIRKFSGKDVIQRSKAKTRHGMSSVILHELGKCHNCPIRDICDKKAVNEEDLIRRIDEKGVRHIVGCNQAKELFAYHLNNLRKPELFIMSEIAYLKTKSQMQEMRDHSNKKLFSNDYFKAIDLLGKYLKLHLEAVGTKAPSMQITAENVQFNAPSSPVQEMHEGDMYIPDALKLPEPDGCSSDIKEAEGDTMGKEEEIDEEIESNFAKEEADAFAEEEKEFLDGLREDDTSEEEEGDLPSDKRQAKVLRI